MGRSGRHERVARRPRDPARARGKRRRRERRASRSHAAPRRARSRGPRPKRIPARSDRGLGRIRRREDPQLRRATRAGGRLRGRLRAGARCRVRSHRRHRPRRGASALEDRARLHRERSAPSGGLAISRRRAGLGALQLLTLVAGLAIAGLAKGATAMGLPLIATPILASVFGPRQAVVIITIPIFVANTILVLQSWRVLGYLRSLGPLVAANAAGTMVGALLLAGLDQRTFAILITAMVVVFITRGERIVGEPGARRAELLTPVVGFVGGVMQGTTSISSPVIGSFFHAMKLPPREYVITLAAVFQLSSAVGLVSYAALGFFTPDLLTLGVIACIPMLLALMAGIALRGRLDQARFRQVIVLHLVASVANLLWRTFLA